MSKPRVFVTRLILENGLVLLNDFCDADIWLGKLPPTRDNLLNRVRDREGLLCLLTDRIDDQVMDSAGGGLMVISNCAAGVDNIDLTAATARGIPVGYTPGVLTDATADFTFALLLAAARHVVEGDRQVHCGGWKTWAMDSLLGADFAGATLGLVGYGRIGQAVARRATGFGMKVIYSDPNTAVREPGVNAVHVSLDTLLREADFISLHTPLTKETHGMINAAAFAKMKPTCVLVNTSRGAVVDQSALFEALNSKKIYAAALDVTSPEPLQTDSPLLAVTNCIVVPHIASASYQTRQKMSQMAAENLLAGLKKERLPNCINPEVYDGRKFGIR